MAKYVDTTRMAALLNIIEGNVKEIKTAIDNYSAKAPSLGESSFLGTVEGNLNSVKEEYDLRSTNVENASL